MEVERSTRPELLKATIAYFGLVFGTGFILGVVRVLLIVPRLGSRGAELLEAPVMLIVTASSATWVVKRFRIRLWQDQLLVGVFALVLLISIEFTVVLTLRGMTLSDYFSQRDPVAGIVYYLMLAVFAVMPLLVARLWSSLK